MALNIDLIVIGKYKNKSLEDLEGHYCKQLNFLRLNITELKAHSENSAKEEEDLEKLIQKKDFKNIFLLTEKGETFEDSFHFSHFIEKNAPSLTFIISGAQGFSKSFKQQFRKISLSGLTLPHKLCRLILVEQIYRAQTILTKHPYHN